VDYRRQVVRARARLDVGGEFEHIARPVVRENLRPEPVFGGAVVASVVPDTQRKVTKASTLPVVNACRNSWCACSARQIVLANRLHIELFEH
jgi:hypothetical protein